MNYKILILLVYILYAGMEFLVEEGHTTSFSIMHKFNGRGSRHFWKSNWTVAFEANC